MRKIFFNRKKLSNQTLFTNKTQQLSLQTKDNSSKSGQGH